MEPWLAEAMCIKEALTWLKSLGLDNIEMEPDHFQFQHLSFRWTHHIAWVALSSAVRSYFSSCPLSIFHVLIVNISALSTSKVEGC
ncbi:hypothetical protein J1N35_040466 [Gossypium stocksii]|uniref:Uncharacterized protein n=1 Tax=Gossypium stocksii TaxID=47602 RepID=A0A9D3UE89_9ROSI|nr:hypothetical protein J1N35_040466 [Gossypium stocksii]